MAQRHGQLIACHDCDLLQREIPLKPGCTATCRRCGAALYRNATDSINRTLAYTVAASILFVIANLFPILTIELSGDQAAVTLFQSVVALWEQEYRPVSAVVFITTIIIPAVELSSFAFILLPLKLGQVPFGYTTIMRTLQVVQPWSMVEVFLLGVLVSLVKLTQDFRVIPGIALWSFGFLTLMIAAVAASFSARDVWCCLDEITGRGKR